MSFGWSVSDIALLVRLAYKTTQGARAACGEFDELTRETYGLHAILQRLKIEADKPHSFINRPGETYKQELESISSGCQHVLTQLDKILDKYNALSDQEKSVRKLWKQVRFGSGAVADVADLRSKITSYTAALSLFINLVSMKTVGEVERQMNRAGGDLRDIKIAVNSITARLSANAKQEGSVFTAYTNDDKDAWRELRRGLVRQGFRDGLVRRHMKTIMAYVKELGTRGILDDVNDHGSGEGSRKPGMQENFYQVEEGTFNSPGIIHTKITRNAADQSESRSPTPGPSPFTAPIRPRFSSNDNSKTNGLSNISRQPYVESASESDSHTDNVHGHLEQAELCSTLPPHPDTISHDAVELARQNPSLAKAPLLGEPSTDSEEEQSHQGVPDRALYAFANHPRMASDIATNALKALYYLHLQHWPPSPACPCLDTQRWTKVLRQLRIPHFISDGRAVHILPLHNAILTVQSFQALVKILIHTPLPNLETCGVDGGEAYVTREENSESRPEDPENTSYEESRWDLEEHVSVCLDLLSQMAVICKECEGAEPVLTSLRTINSEQVAALCLDFIMKFTGRRRDGRTMVDFFIAGREGATLLGLDDITDFDNLMFDVRFARTEAATCLGVDDLTRFDDLIAKIQAWCHGPLPQLMPLVRQRAPYCSFPIAKFWCAGRWGNGLSSQEHEDWPRRKFSCVFHDRSSQASRVRAFGETSIISQYYLQGFQPRPDDTNPTTSTRLT